MGPNTLCAPQPTPCSPTWGSRSAVAHREKQNPPIPPQAPISPSQCILKPHPPPFGCTHNSAFLHPPPPTCIPWISSFSLAHHSPLQ